ncbi:MAG TPA: M20/M25/M40 family metallo-hydrolase [Burkholderiales bacterium]|nr:M20/M25/M40 family metallo-hydrolase [Burkholderiales bacterium]
MRGVCGFVALVLSLHLPAFAEERSAEQVRFRGIYQELVEIDTSKSNGDVTRAARAMAKHLTDAGMTTDEIALVEPFPKKGNLIARLRGTGEKKPLLLVAHLDVVDAKREDWKTDPFKLVEQDGYFTARGSGDDKAMAAAFVSIVSHLQHEGFRPKRDIVLVLSADEEQGDIESNGIQWLVKNRRELIDAELGINEGGGGELRDGKPVLHRLQVAEKRYMSYQFEATNSGGHSSLPRVDNAIYDVGEALLRLRAHRFPVKLAPVTKAYFARSAPLASGQLAADMQAMTTEMPDPAAVERLSALPQYNAQLRTTCVATMLGGGHAENALPQSAKATVSCRLLPHDDVQEVEDTLRAIAGDKVKVTALTHTVASPASPLRDDVVQAVEAITQEMWPGVPVVPAMGTGATDSRFLRNIGVAMYGVSGIFVDPADYRAHGRDERVEVQRVCEAHEFLYRLVKRLTE